MRNDKNDKADLIIGLLLWTKGNESKIDKLIKSIY